MGAHELKGDPLWLESVADDSVSICDSMKNGTYSFSSCPGSIHHDDHTAQTEHDSYRVIAIRSDSVDTPSP